MIKNYNHYKGKWVTIYCENNQSLVGRTIKLEAMSGNQQIGICGLEVYGYPIYDSTSVYPLKLTKPINVKPYDFKVVNNV